MDKRIKYRLVIDTETCPLNIEETAVTPYNMWVYDCGWAVVDKKGNVYKTESFINADIFLDEKQLMKSAYYADKIPKYWEQIKSGERKLTSFYNIKKQLYKDIKNYNITEVFAHNMYFDYTALNNTQRWLTKSRYRYFFPYGIKICDTLKMARQVINKMPSFQLFCDINNFKTKTNQNKLTAEVLYSYIINNPNFKESHTALEDVMIEKEILAYCYKQHKKINRFMCK